MSSNKYYGLSLQERLHKAGIASSFSAAVKTKDISQMATLLQSVEYSSQASDATIQTFLSNPEAFRI
jgi:hypothetical protein